MEADGVPGRRGLLGNMIRNSSKYGMGLSMMLGLDQSKKKIEDSICEGSRD